MTEQVAESCSPARDAARNVDQCRVTFIVIGRNEGDVIASNLEALQRTGELLPSWECIYVDSASEDNTIEIASSYPITVIRLDPGKYLSPAAGRYVGLRHARGEYIMFLDADSELQPEFLPNALDLMKSQPDIAAVIGTRGYRYGRGQDPAIAENLPIEWWQPRDEDVPSTGGIVLMRKAVLDEVGGHNPRMRSEEERELCLRLRNAGYRIHEIPYPMMIHNSAPGQHKFAYREIWRRFRCGFLVGRGQILRLAVARGTFSKDYVLDGTRRILLFAIWMLVGVVCAVLMLAASKPLILLAWLACTIAFPAALWVRLGSLPRALFYTVSSCLDAIGLIGGFVKGCPSVISYRGTFQVLKEANMTPTPHAQRDPGDPAAAAPSGGCSKLIRLLLVGPFAPAAVSGGMEKQIALFIKSKAAKRLAITTFDTQHGGRAEHSNLGRVLYAPIYILGFLGLVLRSRADVLQIRTTSWIVFWKSAVCALIGKACGRKVILSIHAPDFEDFFNACGAFGKTCIRWTLEGCDRVIALSDVWRTYILKIAPRTQVVILPNGVEEQYFDAWNPEKHAQQRDKVRLFFIGGGSWPRSVEKGFLDILSALRMNALADRCVLTAGGIIDPEVQRTATDLSLQCPGIIGTDEKIGLFADTDIFVQPSHFENMPNVILEAMAAGVPIVSTSVGAIPEMIDEPRGGILITPEDTEALSAAIGRLVENTELRREMGESNYRRAKQYYRLTSTTERWVNLIYEVSAAKARQTEPASAGGGNR